MAFQRKKPAAVGVKAPFPGFIEPALATSAEKVPSGELSVVAPSRKRKTSPPGAWTGRPVSPSARPVPRI